MENPNYYNYYVETLTNTMTDAIIRNVSLQASVKMNEDLSKDYDKNLEILDAEIGKLKEELDNEKSSRNSSENSTISDLRNQINSLNNELNEIRHLRSEYEDVKHQVNHVETFRNELAKSRKENEDLKKEHELKIKVLNEKIDYLQLTPAKRKKYDDAKSQGNSINIRDGASF